MFLDKTQFAQCRTCFIPMLGIFSVKAREDCVGCGGEALGVWGDRERFQNPRPTKLKMLNSRRL